MADAGKSEPSDRQLVAAMAAGDAHALQALSLRYTPILIALTLRFSRDEPDAEEVVADVLWQAWSDAKSYDPGRGSVMSWLVALARRRAIGRLRARKAQHPGSPPPSSSLNGPPALDAQGAQSVRAAFGALDAGERAALEMAYFSDLSPSQMSRRLGAPPNMIRARIRSAMMKLRHALPAPRT